MKDVNWPSNSKGWRALLYLEIVVVESELWADFSRDFHFFLCDKFRCTAFIIITSSISRLRNISRAFRFRPVRVVLQPVCLHPYSTWFSTLWLCRINQFSTWMILSNLRLIVFHCISAGQCFYNDMRPALNHSTYNSQPVYHHPPLWWCVRSCPPTLLSIIDLFKCLNAYCSLLTSTCHS